jgi:hypothetical protein
MTLCDYVVKADLGRALNRKTGDFDGEKIATETRRNTEKAVCYPLQTILINQINQRGDIDSPEFEFSFVHCLEYIAPGVMIIKITL